MRVRWSAALLPIHYFECIIISSGLFLACQAGWKAALAASFGREKGLERMEGTHPVWKELFDVYEGTAAAGPGDMCTKCSDTWPL